MTKLLLITLFSFVLIFNVKSQEIRENQLIIDEINILIKPDISIALIKGVLTTNIFKHKILSKKSILNIEEIDPLNIKYSTKSKQIIFTCNFDDSVENRIYGINKSKKHSKYLRLHITDTIKGEKVKNLFRIIIREQNKESITKIISPALEYKLNNHLISCMPFLLFYNGFGLSYEYITENEKMGIYLPFAFIKDYKEGGVALKFYTGQNKAYTYNLGFLHLGAITTRYFLGPEIFYTTSTNLDYSSLRLQNGISFQSKKHFNLTMHISAGGAYINRYINSPSQYKKGDFMPDWNAYISIGYRF